VRLAAPSATQVTDDQLRWMSVCLVLALAVHAGSLPVWLLATIAAAIAIRLALSARGYAVPSRTIRAVVCSCAPSTVSRRDPRCSVWSAA
jgi:hypothetical protein